MKLNRKLVLVLALVLSVAMATGGTMAYLTSTDSDVNVMTLGNVKIEQHEYERVVDADGSYKTIIVTKADGTTQESYELQEFTQDKPLLPAVGNTYGGYDSTYVRFEQLGDPNKVSGGQQFFANLENAQDKIVLIENTGKTDAYVRTIFAFEMGKLTDIDEWHTIIQDCTGSNGEPWRYEHIDVISIDGNNYALMEAVYTGYSYGNMRHKGGILPAGEWTYNNLAQVYMTSAATNEDVEALDGNNNGTYDILVLSQAVQAAGFENATTALNAGFGVVNAVNAAEWFGGIVIPSVPSLPDTLWADTAVDSWYTDNTDADVYEISTAAQLAGLAKMVNEHSINDHFLANKTIKLTADIDLSGSLWTPIGVANSAPFYGTFDGDGHTISNVVVNAENQEGVGLFGAVFFSGDWARSAGVKNLTVENATIIGKENAGAIVGHSYGSIEGCTVKNATISVKEGKAGAIVGTTASDSAKITITDNTAENITITNAEGDNEVGGIAGRIWMSLCTFEDNTFTNATVNGMPLTVDIGDKR